MVARAKQRLTLAVPYRESEVALQVGRAGLAPFQVGAHDEHRVGKRPVAQTQPRQKLVAVVQPAIGRDGKLAAGHRQRAGSVLAGCVEPGMAERHAALRAP